MEAEKGFHAFFKFVLKRPNLSSLFMIDLPHMGSGLGT